MKAITKMLLDTFGGYMLKRSFLSISIIFVFVILLGLAGCNSTKEPENNATATPAANPAISFGEGFSALEGSGDNTWRWMGKEGTIKLKSSDHDMRLLLVGTVPLNVFPQPSTLKVLFNGEQLDQFPGTHNVTKEYTIPAAKMAGKEFSELKIISDKTWVPKELDKNSTDDRTLAFSVTKLEWTAR